MDNRGTIFGVACLCTVMTMGLYVWCVNPEVVVARVRFHKGTKRWDIILLVFLLPALYATFIVAALDNARFHWLPIPCGVSAFGYVLFLAGAGIFTWALSVNKFFECTVRVQSDRGHTVSDTGPYAVVRHPGYVGVLLLLVGGALCLDRYDERQRFST